MRIAHVNLASGFRGGERQTVLLIKQLSEVGVQQFLICKRGSPLKDHLADVVDLIFIDAHNQFMGHFNCPQVDVVHAHEAKAVHWAYLHFVFTKTPYIITRRVDALIKDKMFNRLTYSRAASRVSISHEIRSLMSSSGFGESVLIPSASADFEVNKEVSEKIKLQYKGYFLVGQAGALVDKHKGQLITIAAAKILASKYPDIKFIFLGAGEDETLFKRESSGFDNIEWLGFKDNVADYIAALDLFVFPSRNEGLGSVLLDAMILNVPIIASNVGGIPDIVRSNQTGLLIPPNSPELLAEAIETIYLDSGLRDRLVSSASVFVKDYSSQKMANRYMELYRDVVDF